MYFEYISLCLFWTWLIYLMPIYCCFYVSWFCFTNWKQIKGMKMCCLSNVKQTMHQHFHNSCYSLHSCFAVSALGDDFTKKKVIFISLYLLICNILCFTVSYLIRCVVVTARKMILFREFPNHDKIWKQSQSHYLPSCSYGACCHLQIAPRAGILKSKTSSNVGLGVCRKLTKFVVNLWIAVFSLKVFSHSTLKRKDNPLGIRNRQLKTLIWTIL